MTMMMMMMKMKMMLMMMMMMMFMMTSAHFRMELSTRSSISLSDSRAALGAHAGACRKSVVLGVGSGACRPGHNEPLQPFGRYDRDVMYGTKGIVTIVTIIIIIISTMACSFSFHKNTCCGGGGVGGGGGAGAGAAVGAVKGSRPLRISTRVSREIPPPWLNLPGGGEVLSGEKIRQGLQSALST
jgi:hypothetical protein